MSECKTNSTCVPKQMASLELPLYNPCECYTKENPTLLYDGYLVHSLSNKCNKDNPLVGALKKPPTWEITPLSQLAQRTQCCGAGTPPVVNNAPVITLLGNNPDTVILDGQ